MHYRSRKLPCLGLFVGRAFVAAILVLALLGGVAPLSTHSASANHFCTMECCVGLPPHVAGSCHMEVSPVRRAGEKKSPEPQSEPEADELCGLPGADKAAEKSVALAVKVTAERTDISFSLDTVTIDASHATDIGSDHCHVNSQAEAGSTQSRSGSSKSAKIAVQSFSKPCPPECSIGVITSGVRPSRDAASLANSVRPRAPARGEKHRYLALDFSITSAYGEQVRPRGPPVSFS